MYLVILTRDRYLYGSYDTKELAQGVCDGLNEMVGKRLYKVVKEETK